MPTNSVHPRLFWTDVLIRQPQDDRQTPSVEFWYVHAEALSQGGTYTLAVSLKDNRSLLRRSADFQISRNEARPRGKDWYVGGHTLDGYNSGIWREDGEDFGSLREAVWMCIEKTVEMALADITGALNRHRTEAHEPYYVWARDPETPSLAFKAKGAGRTLTQYNIWRIG